MYVQNHRNLKNIILLSLSDNYQKKRLIAEESLLFSKFCRTSCSIYLAPFNLGETEEFLKMVKQIEMNRHQILELYMILGGIPYYLDMLRKDLPLTKNIDNLFFKENANLKTEYEFLFRSLFKDSKNYRKVVEALSEKKKGLSREEIKEATHIKEGGTLTEILSNLTQCDFIREYNAIGKENRDSLFQLTDLFTLLYCLSATWTKTTKLIRCIIHNGGHTLWQKESVTARKKNQQ